MKKLISIIVAGILVAMGSMCVMADNTEFIEYCKENYTLVDISGESSSVSVSGVENLWDDRSIVSEDELVEAQNYNSENEDEMYYLIKLNVLNQEPGLYTVGYDPETGEEDHNIYASENIQKDAGFSKLFDANVDAYMNIDKADSSWHFVSIEKHLKRTYDDQLISAACSSQESYTITFDIPSYYKGCNDLRLAKLSDGQVTYFDGIDSEADSYTITASGSAVYVFAGTRIQNEDSDKGDMEIGRPVAGTTDAEVKPSEEVNPTNIPEEGNNNSGKATAPQTSDSNNIVLLCMVSLAAVSILICSKKAHRA